jgi:hypothetical protein
MAAMPLSGDSQKHRRHGGSHKIVPKKKAPLGAFLF